MERTTRWGEHGMQARRYGLTPIAFLGIFALMSTTSQADTFKIQLAENLDGSPVNKPIINGRIISGEAINRTTKSAQDVIYYGGYRRSYRKRRYLYRLHRGLHYRKFQFRRFGNGYF